MTEERFINANQTKKYVKGTYLCSTEEAIQHYQSHRAQDLIEVQSKGNIGSLTQEIRDKKQELVRKKEKIKKENQMLIPIRDTPVEPLPEQLFDNNKCERATQEQFQYFQTYISQKQKQKKLEEEEKQKLLEFQQQQQKYKKNQQNQQRKCVSLLLERQQPLAANKLKLGLNKKKPIVKLVIKKKDNITKSIQEKQADKEEQADKEGQGQKKSELMQTNKQQATNENQKVQQQEQQLEKLVKVRVIQS